MKQSLKPNHLAQTIDHQRSAARSLPRHLTEKCLELKALTTEIKILLGDCLPLEILDTLWVGKYENGHLTLSVESQTAANHLRYQSNNLINILKEQSFTFNQLNHIDIIVTHYVFTNLSNNNNSNTATSSLKSISDKAHKLHGLSEATKRTIAHTAEHVIKDERLKRSLKKLAKR